MASGAIGIRQCFVCTHSSDFLRSIVNAAPERLCVLRITRDGNVNQVQKLAVNELSDAWRDPLLAHSNVLDGLFYSSVAVCESDADCQFYRAVMSYVSRQHGSNVGGDWHVCHVGGKDRVHTAIRALRAIGVPAHAIVDIDAIRDTQGFARLCGSCQIDEALIKRHISVVRTAIESMTPELSRSELRQRMMSFLDRNTAPALSAEEIQAMRELARRTSPWTAIKRAGKAGVPSGEPIRAFEAVESICSSQGIHLVPVGELERFVPQVPGHGPSWVVEALSRDIGGEEFANARQFVDKILNSALSRVQSGELRG